MFERFTDRARRVVVLSQEEARMLNHNYIGTEHILLGLIHDAEIGPPEWAETLHEDETAAAAALRSLGISLETLRQQVEEIIGQGAQSPSGHIPFTPRAKKVLELSLREALQLGENYIGTEHILLGLIREGDGVAAQVLVRLGADMNRTRQQENQLPHRGVRTSWTRDTGAAPETGPLARFTDRARLLIGLAQQEAERFRCDHVGPEHILLGLIQEAGQTASTATVAMRCLGVSLTSLRRDVEERIRPSEQPSPGTPPLGDPATRALESARREALELGHNYVGTQHLLLGLIRGGDDIAARALQRRGADLNRAREIVTMLLRYSRETPVEPEYTEPGPFDPFRYLSEDARIDRPRPVLGRSPEIQQVIQALTPGTPRIPVLVGEHGIGVSAVVRGLVEVSLGPQAPPWLAGREVREVDVHALVDSEVSQEDLDGRLTRLAAHTLYPRNTLLFIRNAFAPAPSGDGPVLAAPLLPGLLNGQEARIIAAATPAEYAAFGATAGPLRAGFRDIQLVELPDAVVADILRDLRDTIESRHLVTIPDEAVTAALTLSARYLRDRPLPGKAVDLLTAAAARAARRTEKESSLAVLEESIARIRREKETAIDAQDWELAAGLRDQEKQLLAKRSRLERAPANLPPQHIVEVTEQDVTEALDGDAQQPAVV